MCQQRCGNRTHVLRLSPNKRFGGELHQHTTLNQAIATLSES